MNKSQGLKNLDRVRTLLKSISKDNNNIKKFKTIYDRLVLARKQGYIWVKKASLTIH